MEGSFGCPLFLRRAMGVLAHAEIDLGSRTLFEYLLSPVLKIAYEAGRER
jgi:hypothetical protein